VRRPDAAKPLREALKQLWPDGTAAARSRRMHPILARFIRRHEPPRDWRQHGKSALAAAVTVTLIGWLAAVTGLPLLLAPLAPTALLVFGQPEAPGAQPINIFAGYLIATILAALAMQVVPEPWWLATVCVGLSMLLMLVLRVTHPPAAAVPLLTLTGSTDTLTLFGVIFAACTILVALGAAIHRLPPRRRYPLPLKDEIDSE